MIKNIDVLAERLKGIKIDGEEVTPEKFIDVISSDEEKEVEASDVHMFNDDELNTLKSNSHKDGIIFGTEKLVKSFRNANELDFEGKIKYDDKGNVDFDGLANHITTPFVEKMKKQTTKPNEEIKAWEEKYNTLKQTYESERGTLEQQLNQLNGKVKDYHINDTLKGSLPELSGIKKEHALTIFKTEYDLEDKDGKLIAKKNGQIIKDKLGDPLPVKDIINDFASQNGWLKENGRNEGNNTGKESKFENMQEAMKYIKDNGIDLYSDEAAKIIQKAKEAEKQA